MRSIDTHLNLPNLFLTHNKVISPVISPDLGYVEVTFSGAAIQNVSRTVLVSFLAKLIAELTY